MTKTCLVLSALSLLPAVVTCGSSDAKRTARSNGAAEAGEAGSTSTAGESGSGGDGPVAQDGAAGAGGDTSSAGAAAGGSALGMGGATEGGAGAGGDAGRGGASPMPEAGAAGAAGAQGETAFSDDFEVEALQTDGLYTFNYSAFAQWDVVAGSVDITVLPNGFIDSPGGYGSGEPAGGTVVDLNGSSGELGTLETKLALELEAGVTYTLSYSLGNARPEANVVTVSLPGLTSATHSQPTTTAFTSYQQTFTPAATTLVKLRFESQGGADQDGLLLDNVALARANVTAAPVPSSP